MASRRIALGCCATVAWSACFLDWSQPQAGGGGAAGAPSGAGGAGGQASATAAGSGGLPPPVASSASGIMTGTGGQGNCGKQNCDVNTQACELPEGKCVMSACAGSTCAACSAGPPKDPCPAPGWLCCDPTKVAYPIVYFCGSPCP